MTFVDRSSAMARFEEQSETDDYHQKHAGKCQKAPDAHASFNVAIHGNRLQYHLRLGETFGVAFGLIPAAHIFRARFHRMQLL